MRRAAKVDANQKEIVSALRKVGRTVLLLHRVGSDCPDILVGNGTHNILLEIKAPGGKLTLGQQQFLNLWRGPAFVVESVEEAIEKTS